ncbi:MAG: N-acetyltransferase [Alphaproteobacteria bacterium]|nr:MAG: N-acetyltransferase [Alphaproteobacteria bacterium]
MIAKPLSQIETERLLLRPVTANDAPEIYSKWGSSAIVAKYMSWKCGIPAETEKFLRYAETAWNTGEEYTWVIALKSAPKDLIGSFGIRVRADDADFGYLLMPEFWGRGYIAEAGQPIIDWCWKLPHIKRIWAVHHADNPNSGRVMRKLGLGLESICKNNKIYPQISDTILQDECLYSIVK